MYQNSWFAVSPSLISNFWFILASNLAQNSIFKAILYSLINRGFKIRGVLEERNYLNGICGCDNSRTQNHKKRENCYFYHKYWNTSFGFHGLQFIWNVTPANSEENLYVYWFSKQQNVFAFQKYKLEISRIRSSFVLQNVERDIFCLSFSFCS